jgi:hypothetical protein
MSDSAESHTQNLTQRNTPMPSIESRLADVKARHTRERDEFESRFKHEKDAIKTKADKDRQATLKQHREQSSDPKMAGQPKVRVQTDAEYARNLGDAFAEVDARRATERKQLDANHTAEIDAVSSGKQSAPSRAPQAPDRSDPLHGIWDRLDGKQRARWHAIKDKYATKRQDLDGKQGESKERLARYSKSYSKSHDENSHAQLAKEEHRELEHLAAGLEGELESQGRRAHSQAAERAEMDQRHAAANRRALR